MLTKRTRKTPRLRDILLHPYLFVYLSIIFFLVGFFILSRLTGADPAATGAGVFQYFSFYINALSVPLTGSLWWIIKLGYIALLVGVLIWLVRSLAKPYDQRERITIEFFKKRIRQAGVVIFDGLQYAAPLVFSIFCLSYLLGAMNEFNRTRLADELLMHWDLNIFGSYPFISMAGVRYSSFFIQLLDVSYSYLPATLILFATVCFFIARREFIYLAGVFCLSMMIAVSFWLVLPALTPLDRYIDNAYRLPISPAITSQLAVYHPQELITEFQKKIRVARPEKGNLLTSSFPSAHVIWAILLAYFGLRVFGKPGVALVVISIFSTVGTVVLGQHYAVDAVAAFVACAISIWTVSFFNRS